MERPIILSGPTKQDLAKEEKFTLTMFYSAIKYSKVTTLTKLLKVNEGTVRKYNKFYFMGIQQENPKIMEALLIDNPNAINITDQLGNTLLMINLLNESQNAGKHVALLLEYGSDVNAYNIVNETALHMTIMQLHNNDNLFGPLFYKICNAQGKQSINRRELIHGNTPLHLLIEEYVRIRGGLQKVKHLLQHGADLNATNAMHRTAIRLVVTLGFLDSLELVKYLIQKGANVAILDDEGCTPLIAFLKWYAPQCSSDDNRLHDYATNLVTELSNASIRYDLFRIHHNRKSALSIALEIGSYPRPAEGYKNFVLNFAKSLIDNANLLHREKITINPAIASHPLKCILQNIYIISDNGLFMDLIIYIKNYGFEIKMFPPVELKLRYKKINTGGVNFNLETIKVSIVGAAIASLPLHEILDTLKCLHKWEFDFNHGTSLYTILMARFGGVFEQNAKKYVFDIINFLKPVVDNTESKYTYNFQEFSYKIPDSALLAFFHGDDQFMSSLLADWDGMPLSLILFLRPCQHIGYSKKIIITCLLRILCDMNKRIDDKLKSSLFRYIDECQFILLRLRCEKKFKYQCNHAIKNFRSPFLDNSICYFKTIITKLCAVSGWKLPEAVAVYDPIDKYPTGITYYAYPRLAGLRT